MEPGRFTPHSKHYALSLHWFRSKVFDPSNNISVVKIDSKDQLGDMFTKGLGTEDFVRLRARLMGW